MPTESSPRANLLSAKSARSPKFVNKFIAVLAHDLRTPARSIGALADFLLHRSLDDETATFVRLERDSALRMLTLNENLLDLARGRLGGGLSLSRDANALLKPVLQGVIAELGATAPGRIVETAFTFGDPINCDSEPHCATLLESSRQRPCVWRARRAGPRAGDKRRSDL